jgi:hypothetical protein
MLGRVAWCGESSCGDLLPSNGGEFVNAGLFLAKRPLTLIQSCQFLYDRPTAGGDYLSSLDIHLFQAPTPACSLGVYISQWR